MARNRQDLKGKHFGEWEVLEYLGNSKWLCRCSCGVEKEILTGKLTSHQTMSCGHSKLNDITGKHFGDWEVLEYAGNMMWKCKCSCGTIREVYGKHLREGKSKSCGHNGNPKKMDLTDMDFGEYHVLRYYGDKKWLCQCSCGKIKAIDGYRLRNGFVTSCGHTNRLRDLSGRTFGNLKVVKYIGYGKYECKCKCGNTVYVTSGNLLNDSTKSCGCLRKSEFTEDRIIEAIQDYTFKFGEKPFKYDIAEVLGISYGYVDYLIRKYQINIDLLNTRFGSKLEKECYDFVRSIAGNEETINIHERKVVPHSELDIYLPNYNIAIEMNGIYWHSERFKDKTYHTNKAIACRNLGIQLIHIYEHEWKDPETRKKIENLIRYKLSKPETVIYGRNCIVKAVDSTSEKDYLNRYHLQEYAQSKICLGLYYKENLISLMSFGSPRFNSEYQWEIIRYCPTPGISVVGGAEKIFKYFIETFKPESIITYSSIDKFSGDIYNKLGFIYDRDTEPGYIWVSTHNSEVIPRYKTQLNKLKELGLEKYGSTENDIMTNLGYIKLYNCGNRVYTWNKYIT